jgi:hypothetical protein
MPSTVHGPAPHQPLFHFDFRSWKRGLGESIPFTRDPMAPMFVFGLVVMSTALIFLVPMFLW